MDYCTPVGRLVWGSPFEGSDIDWKTKQKKVIKSGPNAGKPAMTWAFGVAYPKALANGAPNEEFNGFFRNVIDVARATYPQFFNGPIDAFTGKPGCTHPRMTFKIKDGDGIDADGKPNNQKEGWAGHWVVTFSSMFAPRCYEIGKFAPEQQITDKSRIQPGDFVAINGTCEGNIGSDVPGVYMNGNMVCLVAGGPRIVTGPKASDAFANIPMGSLPAGCVPGATPANVAPAVPGAVPQQMPSAPGMPAHVPGAAPVHGYAPAAVAMQVPATSVAAPVPTHVTPNHGFVANAGMPPAPPAAPVAPPAPVGPQMTPAGAALGTYEQFRAQGWDDAQMRGAGYLV